jgi:hypothetical protein
VTYRNFCRRQPETSAVAFHNQRSILTDIKYLRNKALCRTVHVDPATLMRVQHPPLVAQ